VANSVEFDAQVFDVGVRQMRKDIEFGDRHCGNCLPADCSS
jgi:hypothetical protein